MNCKHSIKRITGILLILLSMMNITVSASNTISILRDNQQEDAYTDDVLATGYAYPVDAVYRLAFTNNYCTGSIRVNYVGGNLSAFGLSSQRSAVKFDISSVSGTILSATFKIYVVDANANPVVNLISTTDNTWTQTNQVFPAYDVTNIINGYANSTVSANSWKTFDVKNYLQSKVDANSSQISFVLTGIEGGDQFFNFVSNLEVAQPNLRPVLEITYTPLPGAPVVTAVTPTCNPRPTWNWTSGGGGNGIFRYKLDNSDLTSGATVSTNTYYTPGSDLSQGAHTLYVQESNGASPVRWSPSGSVMVATDRTPPEIYSGTLASSNGYVDIQFYEGLYGASDGSSLLNPSSFSLIFNRNSGNATNAFISSVKKNDNTNEASASALTGGESIVRVFLSFTGTPSGAETIELKAASIFDKAGNPMSSAQTSGVKTLNDKLSPLMQNAERTDNTHLTITLSEYAINTTKANDGGFTVCETGNPGITYAVSSIAQGTDPGQIALTVANMDISGKEGVTVKYTAGGNGTVQDGVGNNMATNSTGVSIAPWDVTAPVITSATLATDNSFVDIHFSEGVYSAGDGITALTASKFSITFTKNSGGNATNAVISSIRKNDNTIEGSASALTGGETTVRAFLSVVGTPSGSETVEIKPTDASSIFDKAGNAVSFSQTTGSLALNDKLVPTVTSINRLTPAGSETNAATVVYRVTFSENVTGVDAGDFSLTLSGVSGNIASVSSSTGTAVDVTVNTITGNGTLRLDLKNNGTGIADNAGNSISGGFTSGQSFTIDNLAPSVNTIIALSGSLTGSINITYQVSFSENVNGVDVNDFSLSTVGVTGNIVSVSASSGNSILVNIFATSGYGTMQLQLKNNGTGITDNAGNLISGGYLAGQTIMVDRMIPYIYLINRQTPTGASTNLTSIVYRVNFNESVTGVDISDFSLAKTGTASGIIALVSAAGSIYDVTINSVSGNGTLRLDLNNSGTGIVDQVNNPVFGGYYSGQLYTIDNAGPMVSSVDVPSNATYVAGQNLDFTANYNEAVDVTGTPYIPITLATGGTVNASYQSGSGTTALVFRYPVTTGNYDNDGVALGSAITLNGGTIQDAAGNNATLTLAGVGSATGVLVDAIVPAISSVSSTTANGTYKTGDVIAIWITFSEAVTVSGTPTLSLNSGGTASYASGSGSSVLIFMYTVINGNSSSDLDYSSTSALSLAGGTIKDAAGNSAVLTLPLTGGGSSLGGLKNIVIDGIAPTVSSVVVPSNATYGAGQNLNFTVNFSEAVTVVTTGGIPSIPITLATGGTVSASYQSGSGTTALVFRYTVATGNFDNDGVTIGSAIELNSGTLKDAAGNNVTLTLNGTCITTGVLVDAVPPAVIISSTAANSTNSSSIPVTITFSKPVTGFDVSDISVTNGSKGTLSGSGDTYNLNITPSGQGTVTVNIAAASAQDAAGNTNTAATPLSRTFDSVSPTVTITSSASDPTNVSPVPFTITFSEPVTGFDASDISVSNGTKGAFSGSGSSYTMYINSSGQTQVTLNIAAGAAQDAAGNNNTIATPLVRNFDDVPPFVSITTTASEPTNLSVIPVTITFSEPVTGFSESDISVSNGTKGALSGSGTTYTLNITPSAQGTVSVMVSPGTAHDAAGNLCVMPMPLSRIFDNQAPTVIITSAASNYTNISPIPVTITFSEPVTGFDASDITVVNGTKGTLSGSGTTYNITITPSGQGAVTVDVAGGAAKDAVGNDNSAASQFSCTYDSQSPSVTIASTTSNTTNASPIPVTITFSEPVTGFDASDITVVNGTKGTLSGSGAIYTIDITPSAQGAVTVNIAGGAATDAAGNTSSPATQFSRIYDNQAPGVSVTSPIFDPTNLSKLPVNIVFSEEVTGFTLSDVSVYNGTASDLQTTDNIHWTVNVSPKNSSMFTITVQAGAAQDLAGNDNTQSPWFQRTYDPNPPTVTLSSTSPNPTRDKPMVVNIKFSETVVNFNVNNIKVVNGTASNLQADYYRENWTVDIYPSADGVVTVDIPAGAAQDYATNNNTAAVQFSRTCDITPPTVVISSTSTTSTNSNPIPVTITFSEPVSGFDAGDITVVNGTKGALAGSGSTYTIDITPSAQGPVTIDIGANVAQDAVGNGNIAAAQFSRTFDNMAPSVSSCDRQTPAEGLTNASSVVYRITFNENVKGLDVSDFSLASTGTATGTIASVSSASGTIIDVTVNSVSGDGTLRLDLKNSGTGITDDAGNNISTGYTSGQAYTIDKTAPSVIISSATTPFTNVSPIPVTFTFSEPVTGFDASDITVVNGTKGTLSGSGAIYTIDITPSAQGAVTVNIAEGAAKDAAGNISFSATQFSRTYDNQAPGVSITSSVEDPTNISTIPVNIVFSEAVTGFTLSDISTDNCTASDLQTTDNIHWTVTITPIGWGGMSVQVLAGVAQDQAGNSNTAAPYFQRTYDPNPPTVTLSSTSPNPTKDKPMVVNIKFSETVVNFNVNNIKVVNGTASNLQADYYRENWTVDIYPSADGVVTVDIPAGAAQDYATNNNTAAVQFSRTCDITPPTVVISSTSTTSTNSNPIPVTITFSEPVSGFDAGDITVVNGTKGALAGSGSTYTIDITPSAQGPVTVNIEANVAQDAVGNGNIAAAQFSRTFDNMAPSVSSFDRQSPSADLTNASSVVYRITFNENVKGLDVNDFSLASTGTATGTIASVSSASGTIIDVTVDPVSGDGTLRLDLNNSGTGITDDAGNNISTGYTSGQAYTIDKTAPSVIISSGTNSFTNVSPIPVTFTFSEPVTGFDADDITVTNGTKGTFSGSGDTYTMNIIPSGQGIVTVNVGTGAASDAAGNVSTMTAQISRTFDSLSPSVSISSTATNPTSASSIPVTITFSEEVTGFDITDITVTNGTKGALTGSGNSYSLTVTPTAQGLITVNVGEGIASDAAGNTNSAAAAFSITYATEYLISGNAGMTGVTLRYSDGSQKTVVAGNNGDYVITVPAGWNGSITPEKAGYSFVPASKAYTNVLSNQTSQDYTATAITYTISGNTGVGGATLSYTDGSAKTVTSDASGNYSFSVSWNWSGTVTASKVGYTFSAARIYANVLSDQSSQDYTATPVTGIDEFSQSRTKIYPTVNSGKFNLTTDIPKNGKILVRVINLKSTVVEQFQFIKTSQSATFEIVLRNPAIGFYLVEISMDGYKQMQRIIVE